MKCPACKGDLQERVTKKGVIVDYCPDCHGYWLDQGELNFFCKSRKILREYDQNGLEQRTSTEIDCPKCDSVKLNRGKLPRFDHIVEECPRCKGLFFDNHELAKLNSSKYINKLQLDSFKTKLLPKAPVVRLSLLGVTSVGILISMYAVLFGFIVFLIEANVISAQVGVNVAIGTVALQFFFAPIIMDWSLSLFGSLRWLDIDCLPESYGKSLIKLCKENSIPIPKMGIIEDGSPQAFTYGRTPWSARVVLSRGMFDLLSDDEVEAVLAHELGHVKHWDFVLMTLAQLVPIIFYHLYRGLRRASSGDRDKGAAVLVAAAFISYLCYIISEYFVLFISRLREYYADKFSCYATQNPNALLTGLTKIALGLAVVNESTSSEQKLSKDFIEKRKAVQSMGIMNMAGSKQLLLASAKTNMEELGPEALKDVMRWDLWNPWAGFYELHSTHPLTSKRINAIGAHAINLGQEPYVNFDLKKPESYWDEFFIDLFIVLLPYLLGAIFTIITAFHFESFKALSESPSSIFMALVLGWSCGGLIKLNFVYPGRDFFNSTVGAVLKKVKVSPVRSYPVKLRGEVIGRGASGNIFSEDMVLKDETGLIYLDHEPFGFNVFFALFKIEKYRGKEVIVEGWFRRAPVPYIEVKRIRCKQYSSTCYTKTWKMLGYLLIPGVYYFFRNVFW